MWRSDSPEETALTGLQLLRVLVHPVGDGEPTVDGEAKHEEVPG